MMSGIATVGSREHEMKKSLWFALLWLVFGYGLHAAAPPEPVARAVELPFEQILPGPITDYEAMRAGSKQGLEYLIEILDLTAEGLLLEGKKGRGNTDYKSWLILRNKKNGKGIAVSLAYSGNWRMTVKPDGEMVRLKLATLPEGLKPFKQVAGLSLPGAVAVEFQGDWDDGAQPIVRFIRSKLLRDLGKDWPLVQFNTWYDRKEQVDEAHLIASARAAKALGCELFVIDAGWMGRDNQGFSQAIGDWNVNRQRLPNGLEPVIREVHRLGMKFGVWVEIECVNAQSEVAKAHPEWMLKDGDKLASRRMALDFGNPEALAWAKAEIDRVVTGFDLDYIKMDFNSNLMVDSEKYKDGEADPLCQHYRGLLELWEYMRTKYPELIVENCSSGSQRADLMTAAVTDTHWISDQVKRADNLAMNFGMTYLFPPESCLHWTIHPQPSAKHTEVVDEQSCFTVSMLGEMGVSGPIVSWDEKTRKIAEETIKAYKEIRPILKNAEVYHLTRQVNHAQPASLQVAEYLDKAADRGVIFAFNAGDPELGGTVKVRGLKPEREYRVTCLIGAMPEREARGSELAEGLELKFTGLGESAVLLVEPADSKLAPSGFFDRGHNRTTY